MAAARRPAAPAAGKPRPPSALPATPPPRAGSTGCLSSQGSRDVFRQKPHEMRAVLAERASVALRAAVLAPARASCPAADCMLSTGQYAGSLVHPVGGPFS